MTAITDLDGLEPGFDVPALPGMDEQDIETPCLVLDLDALERNIIKMGQEARAMGVRLRVHGKMHKSVDVAKLQQRIGGADGVCCQKVAEAEVFARGGIKDILVSNQVRGAARINRLARLPRFGAKISCCVDDPDNIPELSEAAARHGATIGCLVELDCGAGRCGVSTAAEALDLAQAIIAAPGLEFAGIQAYQGAMQHLKHHEERKAKFDVAVALVREVLDALRADGIACGTVTGGGTGSYRLEGTSGVYTELQCGSYAFMDADYGRVLDQDGNRLDEAGFENALFLLTSVMSHVKPGWAICDAGLKVQSVDSGLPVVFGRDDVTYTACSDEHGTLLDPGNVLKISDKLRLVPGHCDPTCNLHDWYVGVRNGKVDCLWPVSARGKAY
ncbi:MAG: DSD1 family PLP-dependent enzyme [Hoeflea sp.]|uniref:3-hydroxy-D-aspartate aldolase BhcC n=1 Tax=Hoeflea sp. TaxID=1940281 RepID=UPI001DC27E7B|nr:3-hydroxy-D-aspartate aldolase BhcC [Hoeflea sp.]MBU4527818.1 DSD1 family PLP-dependent enzyme [Alphaproteobacteria bacterium]MBU4546147.1 DSD1 family PLP-dependent enzyme [Alphaproteobacteria bacterium]MBU4553168.1 DSD1 family PLP-dependent enzyme [Alphaproteobacteria bacterium]MBV1724240.1 DSD1 family PLP-dependent enzyme [Hoeflea sp.]MBV1759925.1 DSD1 family PLP-dependent enzyme [Hoeflea sp.]